MGFRPPLDIDALLQQHAPGLGIEPPKTARLTETERLRRAYVRDVRERRDALVQEADQARFNTPQRAGIGPDTASSCTDLALDPQICWDVNGYYASLGVGWRASRKELGLAYLAAGGHTSVYLTYVLSQLLNPDVRRAYDRMGLGEVFLDDDYVQAALKRQASSEASRRSAAGATMSADEVLDEWGYMMEEPEDSYQDSFDSEGTLRHDDPAGAGWGYSYYVWRTTCDDVDRLRTWQEEILHVLAHGGYPPIRFSVGFVGATDQPIDIEILSGDRKIFFLNETAPPLPDHARTAVHRMLD